MNNMAKWSIPEKEHWKCSSYWLISRGHTILTHNVFLLLLRFSTCTASTAPSKMKFFGNFLFSLFLHIIWQIQEHDKFLVSWAAQNYFSIHIFYRKKNCLWEKTLGKEMHLLAGKQVHLKMHFAPLPSELPFYTILPFEIPSNCLVIWIQFGNKLFRFGAANIALFN